MAVLERNAGRFDTYVHSVRWHDGAMAGLIVGTVLFFLTRGIPWVGSGAIDPAIMGREVSPGQEPSPGFFLGVMSLHLILSVLYGLIVAAIVNPFRPVVAGMIGGFVGLVLYFIDFGLFSAFGSNAGALSEWPSLLMHVAFGIIAAEAYKGMTRRAWEAPMM